jgi:hypothetical protein
MARNPSLKHATARLRNQLLLMLVDIDREFLGRRNVRLARLKISWVMAWPPPASVNDLTVGQISFGAQ